MEKKLAEIGLIGGTGFYEFFEEGGREIEVRTRFGRPSDKITLGTLFGKKLAFLPRHGRGHSFPPHRIPYRANIAALKKLGVERIVAPSAVGSLKTDIKPGDFIFCDQFVNRTAKRQDTFFDGPTVAHIEMAYPYCQELREIAIAQAEKMNLSLHPKGTVVVIEGPRFSTLTESLWFSQMGWDLVNMTQYPEVVLASELGICYLNISLVTDYDVGIYAKEQMEPVFIEQVMENFKKNIDKTKGLVSAIIENIPEKKTCDCKDRANRAKI